MINELLSGRYQVQRQLGRQTGRRTFLALDLETQQQVVVKLLYLGQDFDWQDLKLFQREAETLKSLENPAIPRYLDYFEIDTSNDKGFGLVQSYVEGKTLEECLQAGRTFSEIEVKELARSLLQILAYLHHKEPPVIHRDIKPSNILLANRSGNSVGQVYLVDFGSVQNLAAHEGGTITVVGTYGYMPPEQFGGRTTPASDLYSLGATLIYLVTGLHPTELPQQDLQIQFRQSINLSREFADWLEWMTEPSLNQRFLTVEAAIEALDKPRPRKKSIVVSKTPIAKPLGSKIRVIKTSESLEIILPPKGFGIALTVLISIATPIVLITTFPIGIIIKFFAIAFLAFIFLWGFFKRVRVKIDKHHLAIRHDLLGIKWHNSPLLSMRNISKFKLQNFKPFAFSEKSSFDDEDLKAIKFHARLDKYSHLTSAELESLQNLKPLGFSEKSSFDDDDLEPVTFYFKLDKYSHLTGAELEWLTEEINNWLKEKGEE
jgi:serine/threonine protein kinase